MDVQRRRTMYDYVESTAELPLLLLSLAMLPLVLIPLLTELPESWDTAFYVANWLIWSVFAAELVIKTYLSEQRGRYLRQHWFDVLIVVLPFLRPLRVTRSVRVLRVIQVTRLVAVLSRITHSIKLVLVRHNLHYVLLLALLLLLASASIVMIFEGRAEDRTIENYGDALWWAMTTVTTVGYGDTYPTTTEGRGVAVFLMLLGITVFGFITANLASMLVQPKEHEQSQSVDELLVRLERLEQKIDALSQKSDVS